MNPEMIYLSPLFNDHKIGNFGDYKNKNQKDLIKIKEITKVNIFQVAKYKNSNIKIENINMDNLSFPNKYPEVSCNSETRILWTGPDVWLIITSNQNIKKEISLKLSEKDFAITDLSHSRAIIEISGKQSLDVLKKGTPLNLNSSVFKKNNCSNSTYNGISFILDFIDEDPLTFRLFCLRSFGGSFYHSITDAALEYGYVGE